MLENTDTLLSMAEIAAAFAGSTFRHATEEPPRDVWRPIGAGVYCLPVSTNGAQKYGSRHCSWLRTARFASRRAAA